MTVTGSQDDYYTDLWNMAFTNSNNLMYFMTTERMTESFNKMQMDQQLGKLELLARHQEILGIDTSGTMNQIGALRAGVAAAGGFSTGGAGTSGVGELLGKLLAVGARGTGMVLIAPLTLTGSTVQDKNNQYKYLTYTRVHPITNQVYSGRTGGYGTIQQIMDRREAGKSHVKLTSEGFGPMVFDRVSFNSMAIRGREQMLIDFHGGAQSIGGISRNLINGIWIYNPFRPDYIKASIAEFGSLPNNAP